VLFGSGYSRVGLGHEDGLSLRDGGVGGLGADNSLINLSGLILSLDVGGVDRVDLRNLGVDGGR